MRNEGFNPQEIWIMSPKNEGSGFPWYDIYIYIDIF